MKKEERKNIKILTLSNIVSRFGNILFDFANNTFLANLNVSSSTLVAIYQSTENLISIILNILGGVIADTFNRRKILVITDIIAAFSCFILSAITENRILLYAVIGVNIILAILHSFSSPAYKSIIKDVVEDDNIGKLNSILESSTRIIQVLTPLVALTMVSVIGIRGVLLIDGVSFLLSGIVLFYITPIKGEKKNKSNITIKKVFKELKKGFKYLYTHKMILQLVILSAFINFILAGYNLLLPYSNQMFESNTNIYGVFLTAEATGGILGALISSKYNIQNNTIKLIKILGCIGISLIATPLIYILSKNAIITSVGIVLFNLFLSIFNIRFFTIIQKNVDSNYLGRIFSIVFTVAVLFMPLGTMIFSIFIKVNYIFNFLYLGLGIFIISLIYYFIVKYFDYKNEGFDASN